MEFGKRCGGLDVRLTKGSRGRLLDNATCARRLPFATLDTETWSGLRVCTRSAAHPNG